MTGDSLLTTIFLSLKIGILSTVMNFPIALGVAYLLTRVDFKGKSFVEGIIDLPLVMPPVTTGFLLLYILGKKGFIGAMLYSAFGLRLSFTTLGAVIAAMVVSFPLMARSIRVSMEMVSSRLEEAALTLGASPSDVFFKITLPLMFPGILNGLVVGFARSLGEFGATITFAGNMEGISRTIPLSIYSLLQIPGQERGAWILVAISGSISFGAMFFSTVLNKKLSRKQGGL